jgi:predicted O-methyltransferase YrrM
MNLHRARAWIRYIGEVRSPYRIHSPFIYNLATAVLRNRSDLREHPEIERARQHLLSDPGSLEREDYGSGDSGVVAVGAFTKRTAVSARTGRLLFRLTKHLRPNTMLELGTGVGLSTMYMSTGHPGGRCITLEGCPDTARLAIERLRLAQVRAEVRTGPFDETLPHALAELGPIDFAFIDGNHRARPTLDYFNSISQRCHEGSCVVLHDIHWSGEMGYAWNVIRADDRVSVSVDLFDLGLAFFRNQAKQHFVLRW